MIPSKNPYGSGERDTVEPNLISVHLHHLENSIQFKNICRSIYPEALQPSDILDLPPIPVGLFKAIDIHSLSSFDDVTIATSSGTTGAKSTVRLDSSTRKRQADALSLTMAHWLGPVRRPMLIIDSPSTLDDRSAMSARAAAIRSLYKFGKNHHYLLNNRGQVDIPGLRRWLKENESREIFVFGFTFMIWSSLVTKLGDAGISLTNAILFHGGGWKKLIDTSVSPETFSETLKSQFGVSEVHDYYGMVEQLGGIWVEGSNSVLLPSTFNHAIIRDPVTLKPLPRGEVGLIHSFSTLPLSYPGHSILTEDLGQIVPNLYKTSVYGNWGLRIHGRIPSAEPRGCSDAIR